MSLQQTLKVNHIVKSAGDRSSSLNTGFAVSESSGSIGIASADARPSLSVVYPGTDRPPVVLSRDNRYISPFFVKISDQEHLAAASEDQIHIWNLARNTSSVAYKFKESGHWHLCVIDERTVACVAEHSSSGHHLSKIYILNTDLEKFSLNSTIRMKADGTITGICYVKDNRWHCVSTFELCIHLFCSISRNHRRESTVANRHPTYGWIISSLEHLYRWDHSLHRQRTSRQVAPGLCGGTDQLSCRSVSFLLATSILDLQVCRERTCTLDTWMRREKHTASASLLNRL